MLRIYIIILYNIHIKYYYSGSYFLVTSKCPLCLQDRGCLKKKVDSMLPCKGDVMAGELVTRANGDISDRVGRPCSNGQIGIVDPSCRVIGLHLYDGILKVGLAH